MVSVLHMNILMCAARKHIAILLRDNIAATKDEMNTTTGSFALLKSVMVHATSHHCCARNCQDRIS